MLPETIRRDDELVATTQWTGRVRSLVAGIVHAGDSWWTRTGSRPRAPLDMSRSSYDPAEPFARGYVGHPWHGTLREEPRHDSGAMAPAGQLWSTVADLAKWAAFLADPAPSVL